ncbi:hypothetical protein ABW20_dc0101406 [Dactylellina cionopaga]|nr:hypothetical protein ABW20_dc0101406 [Dactylellina cionopaga]
MRHKARLNAEFTRVRIKRGHSDVKSLISAVNAEHGRESEDGVSTTSTGLTTFNPRWIRVNTLKMTMDEALKSSTFNEFGNVSGMSDMFFFGSVQKLYYPKPELLPSIIAIHPSHDIICSELYKSGAIILQSAASCLPAIMLNPPRGSTVVDGCAAPGNKTTHLATLVGSSGRVFAVERDRNRAEILDKMTRKAGADNIVQILKATDFTTIREGHEAWEAQYLLLDPSCSGSGILQRIDWDISKLNLPSSDSGSSGPSKNPQKRKREVQNAGDPAPSYTKQGGQPAAEEETEERDTSKERLQSLSDFQLAIILHAFKFPNAKRITYSTCSIHAEENEQVVLRALESEIAKARGWTVQSREDNPLSTWYRRGLVAEFSSLDASEHERGRFAEGCIRVNRTDGLGGGFFVVCFVRNAEPENILDEETRNRPTPSDKDEGSQPGEAVDSYEGDEWTGFSDAETNKVAAEGGTTPKRRKKESISKNKETGKARINRQFQKNKKGWS